MGVCSSSEKKTTHEEDDSNAKAIQEEAQERAATVAEPQPKATAVHKVKQIVAMVNLLTMPAEDEAVVLQLDLDADGLISAKECCRLICSMGKEITEEEVLRDTGDSAGCSYQC